MSFPPPSGNLPFKIFKATLAIVRGAFFCLWTGGPRVSQSRGIKTHSAPARFSVARLS